jgi:hypothetical protein
MHHVDDRCPGRPRRCQHLGGFGQGRPDAGERQGAVDVLALTVDQHQRRLGQGWRL